MRHQAQECKLCQAVQGELVFLRFRPVAQDQLLKALMAEDTGFMGEGFKCITKLNPLLSHVKLNEFLDADVHYVVDFH